MRMEDLCNFHVNLGGKWPGGGLGEEEEKGHCQDRVMVIQQRDKLVECNQTQADSVESYYHSLSNTMFKIPLVDI